MTTFSWRQTKEMDEGANNRKANKGTASNNNIYHYNEPDFVLKFSKPGNDDVYVILDSKFSLQRNILAYHLEEIMFKYAFGLASEVNKNHYHYRHPAMVWALQGRSQAVGRAYQHQGPDTNKPDTAGDAYRFYDAAPGKMPFSFGVLPFTPEYFEEAGNMNSPIGILWKEITACVPWLREQPDTASTES